MQVLVGTMIAALSENISNQFIMMGFEMMRRATIQVPDKFDLAWEIDASDEIPIIMIGF